MRRSFLVLMLDAGLGAACAHPPLRKEVVSTTDAPAAIGPYSQAVKAGGWLFVSGQLPIDPQTNQLRVDAPIEAQTALVLENLRAVLAAGGMTPADVVSVQVYMADLGEFARMNEVYARFFPTAPPARATIQAARLPRDVKIEIAAIAVKR